MGWPRQTKNTKKKRRNQPGPVAGFFFSFLPKSRKPDGDPRFAGDAESSEEGFATAKVQLWTLPTDLETIESPGKVRQRSGPPRLVASTGLHQVHGLPEVPGNVQVQPMNSLTPRVFAQ
jgi:hypothetical protein